MHDWVVGVVCPDWQAKRAAGQMANLDDADTKQRFLTFLDSDEFKKEFFRLQAERAGVHLPTEKLWDEGAFERMRFFFDAYRWILQEIANAGYNPKKKKNDYNDIHFLLYLSDPELTLVTRDGGISRKVAGDARVVTFEKWLRRGCGA